MKKLIPILAISLFALAEINSQAGIETQLGGSNFIGLSINARFSIPLDHTGDHRISPVFGVGMMAPWWEESTSIIHAGIMYNYKSWGIGTEASGFTAWPFELINQQRNFPDLIIYPNINYTFYSKERLYLRVSAGPYLAFSKSGNGLTDRERLRFEGDIIPGAGIGVGYIIN